MFADVSLVFSVLAMLAASLNQTTTPALQNAQRYALPTEVGSPVEISICSGGETIVFWVPAGGREHNAYILFAFRYGTGELKEILRGPFGRIYPAPEGHLFALDIQDTHFGEGSELVVVDEQGQLTGRMKHPNHGAPFFPSWSRGAKWIAFSRLSPEPSSSLEDYAFNAVGLFEVAQFHETWFTIHPPGFGHSFVGSKDAPLICVVETELEDDPAKQKVNFYDVRGKKQQPNQSLMDECNFWGRRYYSTSQHEIPEAFEIRDSTTGKRVRSFPASDSKGIIVRGDWNPFNDDLLVIEHRNNENRITRLAIYCISEGKALTILPGSPYAWHPDGGALVVFESGAFVLVSVP
jgi:hypothetical protein